LSFLKGEMSQHVVDLRHQGRIKFPDRLVVVLAAVILHHHPGRDGRIVGVLEGARDDHLAHAVDPWRIRIRALRWRTASCATACLMARRASTDVAVDRDGLGGIDLSRESRRVPAWPSQPGRGGRLNIAMVTHRQVGPTEQT